MTNLQSPQPALFIADVFRTPERYYRSVHLARDFHDPRAVEQYVLTGGLKDPFLRILDGLASGSTRRAWRITGDYGCGKSSFALVLAHLARDASAPALRGVRAALGLGKKPQLPKLMPVLVTGSRTRLVPTLARALTEALVATVIPPTEAALAAIAALQKASNKGDEADLVEGLLLARDSIATAGVDGILLVVDELGKFLEDAALRPEHDDVFALQQVAEVAARSGDRPIVLLGLLHQGFQAYAERLGQESRLEWEKVAGRLQEMTFDQPLGHTIALVRAALNVRRDRLPAGTEFVADELVAVSQASGWLVGSSEASTDAAGQYPLHPMMLPVLLRFFSRYGQNERSLFNFLLSHDVGTLQEFSERAAAADVWYTIADFYDYVRAAYGHALGGASYQTHWSRLVDTLDTLADAPSDELRLLKTVAVLNVLDAEHLAPTEIAIRAALCTSATSADIHPLLGQLCRRGVLFERGKGAGYRLWPATSVNLDEARGAAQAALGAPEAVTAYLPGILDRQPLLARRHAIESGTLRHFSVQYLRPADLSGPPDVAGGDGTLAVVLCETGEDHKLAKRLARKIKDPRVVLCVTPPLADLAGEVSEVRLWEWVVAHTPELAHDPYARAEAHRQLWNAKNALQGCLTARIPLRTSRIEPDVAWVRAGKDAVIPKGGLSALLSEVCEGVFPESPRVHHELLNRQTLSSAGAAARMRLIEHVLLHANEVEFGFEEGKTPPERSMYLSVLRRGNVHRSVEGQLTIALPDPENDPLNLAPVLNALLARLRERADERVSVSDLLEVMRLPPFGVRSGLALLLLAVLLSAHGHDIAVFEDGTFRPRFDSSAFLRLSKAPATFSLQWAAVTGVRAAVFDGLRDAFVDTRPGGAQTLLDVVSALCAFAVQQLPPYTQRSRTLGESATLVREALLKAREPSTMLFRELPIACGLPPFEPDEAAAPDRVSEFVLGLQSAIAELRGAYPALLERLLKAVVDGLGITMPVERQALASRAGIVSFRSVDDMALRAFAARLADLSLMGEKWIESVASTVLEKPPRIWIPGDEERFFELLSGVSRRYLRVDMILRHADPDSGGVAYLVGVTSMTGEARDEVVSMRADQLVEVERIVQKLRAVLGLGAGKPELVAVSQLLWGLLPHQGGK